MSLFLLWNRLVPSKYMAISINFFVGCYIGLALCDDQWFLARCADKIMLLSGGESGGDGIWWGLSKPRRWVGFFLLLLNLTNSLIFTVLYKMAICSIILTLLFFPFEIAGAICLYRILLYKRSSATIRNVNEEDLFVSNRELDGETRFSAPSLLFLATIQVMAAALAKVLSWLLWLFCLLTSAP